MIFQVREKTSTSVKNGRMPQLAALTLAGCWIREHAFAEHAFTEHSAAIADGTRAERALAGRNGDTATLFRFARVPL